MPLSDLSWVLGQDHPARSKPALQPGALQLEIEMTRSIRESGVDKQVLVARRRKIEYA